MKVGIIGPIHPDSFASNIGSTFTAMGMDVTNLGATVPRIGGFRTNQVARVGLRSVRAQRVIQERIVARASALDLVITVQGDLFPETVRAIKARGAKVALWFPDAVVNLGRQLMLISEYDALFFKDPDLVRRTRDYLNLPVHYLPQACFPEWHRPQPRDEVDPHIVVVGNCYGSRVRLLERLVEGGVPIRIFGAPIPRWAGKRLRRFHAGRAVVCEEKAAVFRRASGVLNNLHPGEGDGSNLRLFEATASGGAVLAEHRPSIRHLFEPDREVLIYETFDELLAYCRRLLDNPKAGTTLGDAAAARSLQDHTYEHRLTTLLEKLAW